MRWVTPPEVECFSLQSIRQEALAVCSSCSLLVGMEEKKQSSIQSSMMWLNRPFKSTRGQRRRLCLGCSLFGAWQCGEGSATPRLGHVDRHLIIGGGCDLVVVSVFIYVVVSLLL